MAVQKFDLEAMLAEIAAEGGEEHSPSESGEEVDQQDINRLINERTSRQESDPPA